MYLGYCISIKQNRQISVVLQFLGDVLAERRVMKDRNELIESAKAGNSQAFAKLYEEIYKDLYHYALYMLQNRQDAEDAVSDTVLVAFTGIHKLRNAEAFRGWCFQITTNICRKKRKEYLKKQVELEERMVEWVDNTQEALDVRKALKLLTEEERQIIGMSILAGYTSEEIGRSLHLKPGTVRSKLSRSLEKMRKILS